MDIEVELIDCAGSKECFVKSISKLKFLKHASFAGLGPDFAWIPTILHSAGFALHFGSKFTLRPDHIERTWPIHDPDDLRDMSRLTGRVIADIFAKSRFGARYTLCYEHALATNGISAAGEAPDFYCIDHSGLKAFTVEAKGFSQRTIGPKQYARYKAQSKSSQLPIHYSVASVTYNIYSKIKARIEDPEYEARPLDPLFSRNLISDYFSTVNGRLSEFCEVREVSGIRDVSYLAYDATPYLRRAARGGLRIEFLIPSEAPPALQFLTLELENENETAYFDTDGIGLRLIA